MIKEYGLAIVLSVYLVYVLGVGVLLYAALFVWIHLFEYLLKIFKIKRLFIEWAINRNRQKTHPGIVIKPNFIKREDYE